MAPLPPSEKRPSATALRHARLTNTIHPLLPPKLFRPDASTTDGFLSSKADRKLIKSSTFLSRVASSSTRVSKSKTLKRRRPSKKLKTSLEGLADALPELGEEGQEGEGGRVRHRSLKSKRGALKRKEKIVKGEMERFGASMAKLSNVEEQPAVVAKPKDSSESKEVPGTANRWAALRGYISATMEQNPAFVGKK